MSHKRFSVYFGLAVLLSLTTVSAFGAAMDLQSLKPGKVNLKSAIKLAFGPEAILFVGDSIDGKIVALDTRDTIPQKSVAKLDIKDFNGKLAAALGANKDQILLYDAVVNPISKNIYVSVSRGRGPDAVPVILRMDAAGKFTDLSLDNINYSVAVLPNPVVAPERAVPVPGAETREEHFNKKKAQQPLYNPVSGQSKWMEPGGGMRVNAISDMAYANGNLYVAGLTNEEFSSTFRVMPFPFQEKVQETSGVLIYHTSDSHFETNSPIRSFALTNIGGQPTIFAGYGCSPLVKIPLSQIKPGRMVRATTVTEFGGGSSPFDMVVYRKGIKNYLLVASTRPVFNAIERVPLDGMENANELISGYPDNGGVPFEVVAGLEGVVQMDKYDDNNIMIVSDVNGSLVLSTIPTP